MSANSLRKQSAFTLAELLVCMTLFSVLSLMCVRALQMAFFGMRQSSEKTESRRQVLILYQRLRAELSLGLADGPYYDYLAGTRVYNPIPSDHFQVVYLSDPTPADTVPWHKKTVDYWYDSNVEAVFRQEVGYPPRKIVDRCKSFQITVEKTLVQKASASGGSSDYLPSKVLLEAKVATITEPVKAEINLPLGTGGV